MTVSEAYFGPAKHAFDGNLFAEYSPLVRGKVALCKAFNLELLNLHLQRIGQRRRAIEGHQQRVQAYKKYMETRFLSETFALGRNCGLIALVGGGGASATGGGTSGGTSSAAIDG